MTLVRNSDRVGIACQAQLVNTIAPIRAEPSGSSWRQTTFYPFSMIARHARGLVLDVVVDGEQIESGRRGTVSAVEAVATFDPRSLATTVFIVNRSRHHPSSVTVDLRGLGPTSVIELLILADDEPEAANTESTPGRVRPRSGSWESAKEAVDIALPPVSFAMLRLGPA